jgi:hypothetical protein
MTASPRATLILLVTLAGAAAAQDRGGPPAGPPDRAPAADAPALVMPEVEHTFLTACGADVVLDDPDPHPMDRCQAMGEEPPDPPSDRISICKTNDHFGATLAMGGDFDGDGRPDLVVAGTHRPDQSHGHSQLWVLPGEGGRPLLVLEGNGRADRFGHSAVFVPDLDGDGRDELLVGAPRNGVMGRAYLVPGRADQGGARAPASRAAALVFEGNQPGGLFGASVAVGDLDGDGRVDLIVGAPGGDDSDSLDYAGAVHVFPDAAGLTEDGSESLVFSARQAAWSWAGGEARTRFGTALAVAGPLDDQDGDELVISAPAHAGDGADGITSEATGQVMAFRLREEQPLWSVAGPGASAFGFALDARADHDEDGRHDILVGAPLWTPSGEAAGRGERGPEGELTVISGRSGEVILGGDSGQRLAGTGRFGASVQWLDDITGDGKPEILTGAPLDMHGKLPCTRHREFHEQGGPMSGSAWVLDGHDGRPLLQVAGEMGRDRLGWAVSGHDLDGDGLPEIATGALGWSPPAGNPNRTWLKEVGRAYVVNGGVFEDL